MEIRTTPEELLDLWTSTDSVMGALLNDTEGEGYPMQILRYQWRILFSLLGMEEEAARFLGLDPEELRERWGRDVAYFRETDYVGPELPEEVLMAGR